MLAAADIRQAAGRLGCRWAGQLLPAPHSAEQAASLAAALARRARACSELHLPWLLRLTDPAPASAMLELWGMMLHACAGARALHVEVGHASCSAAAHKEMSALLDALPG